MISYLRFMKHTDTDEQLLSLNAEANELRNKIEALDRKTASEMVQEVKFDTITIESFDEQEPKLTNQSKNHFNQKVNKQLLRDEIKPRWSKYAGISFNTQAGRYVANFATKA